MARILCIEDSQEFQLYLSSILKEHSISFVSTITEVLRIVEGGRDNFELILLDVSLPDGNGMKILPQIKESFLPQIVPIIVLSTDNDVLTKVAAFGVGADDYVSKPPDPSELKARINAKLRMVRSFANDKAILEYGNLIVDLDKMLVEVSTQDGKRKNIDLTPYEFKILRLLMARPGQVFSRDTIIDRIWGIDKFITTRTVDAHVSHLRKKVNNSLIQIETVLSSGYKLSLKEKNLK